MAITGVQIRMARAALGWGVRDLACRAQVSPSTIARIENGSGSLTETLEKLKTTLEAGGVEFIPANGLGPGVCLKQPTD